MVINAYSYDSEKNILTISRGTDKNIEKNRSLGSYNCHAVLYTIHRGRQHRDACPRTKPIR